MEIIKIEVCEVGPRKRMAQHQYWNLRIDFWVRNVSYGSIAEMEYPLLECSVVERCFLFDQLQHNIEVLLRQDGIKDYVLSWIGRPLIDAGKTE